MIVDANLLLYLADDANPRHAHVLHWWTRQLGEGRRLGVPVQSIAAYLRIATRTNLPVTPTPPDVAARIVANWLDSDGVWVPAASERTVTAYLTLSARHPSTGALVPDAMLAAMALEHGVAVASIDGDFARFAPDVAWVNPLSTR